MHLYRFLARFYQILVPCAFFLLDWAGVTWHRSSPLPLFGPPRQLADVWWHLPAYLAFAFVYFRRLDSQRRTRQARQDASDDDRDDGDEPITLGL
jgi:hypothetical protein